MRAIQIASVCHAANRALQQLSGEAEVNPEWVDAPEWMQDSATSGVLSALEGRSAGELHEEWAAHRRATGWVWGSIKSEEAKTHPCLVDYDQLPEIQRAKDALFLAVVNVLKGVQV